MPIRENPKVLVNLGDSSASSDPTRRVTLRDIAQRAGVSHVTISRALRDDPSISKERRESVRKLAEEMGYRPDPGLMALAAHRFARRRHQIQSGMAWINRYEDCRRLHKFKELHAYWTGAQRMAHRFGYQLEEISWPPGNSVQRLQQILETRGIRGILLPPHHFPLDWTGFDWSRFCVVRFGMSVRNPDVHAVTSDQLRATVMAMDRIRQLGYRRIGLIVPQDFDRHLGGNYVGGFYAAHELFELGHLITPLTTESGIYDQQPSQALAVLERWLNRHRPDAVLATVAQLPALLGKLGVRVPQDVALAGNSVLDLPISAGINQNSEMIGCIAVETLVSQINLNVLGQPVAPCRILVESVWQDGDSMPLKPSVQPAN